MGSTVQHIRHGTPRRLLHLDIVVTAKVEHRCSKDTKQGDAKRSINSQATGHVAAKGRRRVVYRHLPTETASGSTLT